MSSEQLLLYGDFNCPWSYLASTRAHRLAQAGVAVDWRAVEHEPGGAASEPAEGRRRLDQVAEEMERVCSMLLPGERLHYALAGFVPDTRAAVASYAAAHDAGRAELARVTLFDAFWSHGLNLDNPDLVRTVVNDALRSADPARPPFGDAADAARTVERWRSEWRALEEEVIPVVVVDGQHHHFGVDAVAWLGEETARRGPLSARPD
jgi:2-hydroxychromene-2-carboxylate isomerase